MIVAPDLRVVARYHLQTAVNEASARGVLVVCSAGNDGENTDSTPHYPSSLPVDVIMAVGASVETSDDLWCAPLFYIHHLCVPPYVYTSSLCAIFWGGLVMAAARRPLLSCDAP